MTEHGGSHDQIDPELRDLPVAEAPAGPNRRVRWWVGAVAVLAVAVLVAALAVRAGDDTPTATDDGELRPLPLADAAARLEASAMYGPEPRYSLGAELPDLGGTAPVHELRAPDLGAAGVERMARELGLAGPVVDDGSGTWSVADGDRVLSVTRADAGWYVSYATSGPVAVEGWAGCAPAEDPSAGVAPDCVPPTTVPAPVPAPVALPDEAEAEQIARDLLARLGLLDGEWQAQVSSGVTTGIAVACPAGADCPPPLPEPVPQSRIVVLTRVVDGAPVAGLEWSVAVGDRGVVEGVDGTVAELVEVGDYPLATTAAAYQAMVDGTARDAGWFAASDAREPVLDEPTAPPSTLAPGEPYEVTVTGVELGSAVVAGGSGTQSFVVPVYRFTGTTTFGPWERTVVALDPAWIEPVEPQPLPLPETIPPGAPEPMPLPEPATTIGGP